MGDLLTLGRTMPITQDVGSIDKGGTPSTKLRLGVLLVVLGVVVAGGVATDTWGRYTDAFAGPGSATEGPAAWPGCSAHPAHQPKPYRRDALPADGTPTVAGIELPRGSRCSNFWASDGAVAKPLELAKTLADAYPETGLWPVLWYDSRTDPDSYVDDAGDLGTADRIDAETVIRGLDDEFYESGFGRFAKLAKPGPRTARRGVNPFTTFGLPPGGTPSLLLVPVDRPADVPSVLGMSFTTYISPDELTAVLRSWEDRFGARPVLIGPGWLVLAVADPPQLVEEVELLTAELGTVNLSVETNGAATTLWTFSSER